MRRILAITDGDGVNVDDQAILVEPGSIVELNIAAACRQDLSETLTVTVDGVVRRFGYSIR